jgi:hypothetical protein
MLNRNSNEALPQTVEHVGIYADLSVGLRLGLASLYVVLPRLRRGVALTRKVDSFVEIPGRQGS